MDGRLTYFSEWFRVGLFTEVNNPYENSFNYFTLAIEELHDYTTL
jgi:hypothetical protein